VNHTNSPIQIKEEECPLKGREQDRETLSVGTLLPIVRIRNEPSMEKKNPKGWRGKGGGVLRENKKHSIGGNPRQKFGAGRLNTSPAH